MPARRGLAGTLRLRRSAVVVAVLAVGVSLVVTAPGVAVAQRSQIRWHVCGKPYPRSVQCGEIAVPLDYRHPRGAKIRVAFDRLRAKDRAHRLGSLIINPGGPGGAGSEVVAVEAKAPGLWHPQLRRRFDLIGMDPRGVGRSTPVRCSPKVFNRQVSMFPQSAAEFGRLARYSRDLGRSCRKRTGALLGHVDTRSVVRDMEALRRALGEGRLNFLGLSYGAEIGALYAERYPRRIRAMALDGVLDHSVSAAAVVDANTAGYEDSLGRFAAWCAQTTECALHGRDVVALFDGLVQRANQSPIPASQCRAGGCRSPVTGQDILLNAYNLLLFKSPVPAFGEPGWNGLAQALAAAEAGDASAFATPLLDTPQNGMFAGLAVDCLDYGPLVRGYGDMVSAMSRARTLAPHTQGAAEAWPALVGCMRWPVRPVNPPRPLRVRGAPPILLVNATHDPSTPYGGAQNVARQIPRSVLLTRDGDGHTSSLLQPSRTNDAIARYLVTRKPPPPNTVLPD
jgi:pimeloyl-ACP methyl ester carboxylesterase